MSKKRLGRGLDALLSERTPKPVPTEQTDASQAQNQGGLVIDIGQVQPSPFQPRRIFDDDALAELANSIRTQGLLQPIVVRKRPQGGYELIAGERRWRAAQRAGLTAIPAVLKTASDEEASALALIENIQREDLSALEEAQGLARLRDEFQLTQQQIADAVGKSRVGIANLLRLLNLGSTARRLLEEGKLEMGHARAILGLEGISQDQVAQQVADQGFSVRQTEALVRRVSQGGAPKASARVGSDSKDPDTLRLEQRITERIGAPATIKYSGDGRGELTIKYSTLDELQGVLKHLGMEE